MQNNLILPDDIEVTSYIGKGRRANVYKAELGRKYVIVKVYKNEATKKYLTKYKVDIAQHEYERNAALFNSPKLASFIAKPLRVYTLTSSYTHSMIQEYVPGVILEDLIVELGYLPNEALEAGYKIVQEAERIGVHDLDISVGNVIVNNDRGSWQPKLYDFNMMPQYLFPPNVFIKLALKLGIRKKSHRDYRSLKNWERRGERRIWIGKN